MTRSGATSNVAVLGVLATFASLSLAALSPEAAAAAPPTVWDQSRFFGELELPITTHIRADDFVVVSPTYLLAADVWLADQVVNDNGVLDGFSGGLYWAVYTSAGTTPGTPILTGRAVAVVQTDTGLQTTDGNDMVRVHFELEPAVPLQPGTYWFALHEGVWGTTDGSPLDWLSSVADAGNFGVLALNSATPSGWAPFSDPALVLYGGPLIWSSFEAGVPPNVGLDASSQVVADDFFNVQLTRVGSADVWIADNVVNDNGVLDSFSGTLGWGIYSDVALDPGTLLASASDAVPRLVDSGFQEPFGGDVFHARIRLAKASSLVLSAGTFYWFAMHEGLWGSGIDDSPIWWNCALSVQGVLSQSAAATATPSGWSPNTVDLAFVLFGELVFASGFEAGVTCAWSNAGAPTCP